MTCRNSFSTRFSNNDGRGFVAPKTPEDLLKSVPSRLRVQPVYAYIVTTFHTTTNYQLIQMGSAPNFAGGRISLCTCKHKDRATFHLSNDPADPWKSVWVAGLTSKSESPSRSLAYLMCVERSFLHQVELWRYLPGGCRQAKSASKSELGDLFEPKASATKDPYNPVQYYPPIGGHVHSTRRNPNAWHHDVMRWGRNSLPHRLLLGRESQSYRWNYAKIILKPNAIGVSAHHRKYDSLNDFIADLKEFVP